MTNSKTWSSLFLTLNLVLLFAIVSGGSPGLSPSIRPTNLSDDSSDPVTQCSLNVLNLGICTNLLQGMVNVTLGQPPVIPCCTLFSGLLDIEVAVCFCTALRANIFGIINFDISIPLTFLLNICSRELPLDFIC
ncbi:pEARLI1-like lipid transfer protein 3, partial [Mucuna pruriens]